MKVCMVTPHLPPDQAANALLPHLLGEGLRARGHEVTFLAYAPRSGATASGPWRVTTIGRPANGWARTLRLSQLATVVEVLKKGRALLREADVVHVHSNTFMNQVSALVARRGRRPFILTHYGTEIWHFRRRRFPDPFLWMNRHAAHVTYYSRKLLERSIELGVVPPHCSVVYPPAQEQFRLFDAEEREAARRRLGAGDAPLLLNVKRLHPLADQRTLIDAMPRVLDRFARAQVWIAGEGESRGELERRIEENRLGASVRLLGLVDNRDLPGYYAAADLFVLPSKLEAFPTVAAEALACGTPVVSVDHPGGEEIQELFPRDVKVVPRGDPDTLAQAIIDALAAPRRVSGETLARIEEQFRPRSAVERYLELYREALGEGRSRA